MIFPEQTKRAVKTTSQFRKDFKKAIKQNKDLEKLKAVVLQLANDEVLDEKYRDHALHAELRGFRECHLSPDWLLMYRKSESELILTLVELNSHSNMFR